MPAYCYILLDLINIIKFPSTLLWKPEAVELQFALQIFEKPSNLKFRENLSVGNREFSYAKIDITKLIVAFCNFVNTPKTVPFNFEVRLPF